MSVLSVFNILLSKLSGQEDIIIGTPIAGRNHSDLENIVGMFVNTLAIQNEVNGSNTLKEFIKKLKQTTLEAFENQDYQFEELVENISIERDISRNPVFDVMFSFQNQTDTKADLSGLENNQYLHKSGLSKFDLTLSAVDYGEQLMLSFEYCTKLFKAETIERFISYYREIIRQLPERIDEKLSTLDLLSAEEKDLLLQEFNNTHLDYPKEKSICQLLEEQARMTPDNIAIVKNDNSLSYNELNIKVNQLSKGLLLKGFNLGNKIGVFIDRSIESLITILGVLKTGCVYLPIEKDSPQERLNYIINDSDLDCILDPASVKNNKLEFNLPIFSYQEMLNYTEIELLGNIDKQLTASARFNC
jgi:non-ribosomal peptide synthetase component F